MSSVQRINEATRQGNLRKLRRRLKKYGNSNLWRMDNAGNYTLHCAVTTHQCPEATRIAMVHDIMSRIPTCRHFEHLSMLNGRTQTAIHIAVLYCEEEVLCVLLDYLSRSEIRILIRRRDYLKKSVLDDCLTEGIKFILCGYAKISPDQMKTKNCNMMGRWTRGKALSHPSQQPQTSIICYEGRVKCDQPTQGQLTKFSRSLSNQLLLGNTSSATVILVPPTSIRPKKLEESVDLGRCLSLTDACVDLGDVYFTDPVSASVFHCIVGAVRSGRLKRVKNQLQLISGAEKTRELMERQDSEGKTLLHYAACRSSTSMLRLLMMHVGPYYHQILDKENRDSRGKTIYQSARTSNVRKFLRLVNDTYWEATIRQPNILIISTDLNIIQSDRLAQYAKRMKKSGMSVDHYNKLSEDETVDVICGIQLQNPSGLVMIVVETGDGTTAYNVRRLVRAMCTTAMLYKPKVLIWQRTNECLDQEFEDVETADDFIMVQSKFRMTQLEESMVVSFCSHITALKQPLSIRHLLHRVSLSHVDAQVKCDKLQYSLLLGKRPLTIPQRILSFFRELFSLHNLV